VTALGCDHCGNLDGVTVVSAREADASASWLGCVGRVGAVDGDHVFLAGILGPHCIDCRDFNIDVAVEQVLHEPHRVISFLAGLAAKVFGHLR
jgi:hypothetical protein